MGPRMKHKVLDPVRRHSLWPLLTKDTEYIPNQIRFSTSVQMRQLKVVGIRWKMDLTHCAENRRLRSTFVCGATPI